MNNVAQLKDLLTQAEQNGIPANAVTDMFIMTQLKRIAAQLKRQNQLLSALIGKDVESDD